MDFFSRKLWFPTFIRPGRPPIFSMENLPRMKLKIIGCLKNRPLPELLACFTPTGYEYYIDIFANGCVFAPSSSHFQARERTSKSKKSGGRAASCSRSHARIGCKDDGSARLSPCGNPASGAGAQWTVR